MKVLRAEPKTRATPPAPFSVDPANLLALYSLRLHQPRMDLGEVPLRPPATDHADGERKQQAVAALGGYPLRRIPAPSVSRRRARKLLRWTQRFFLLLGLLGVGTWGWFYAEAKFSQAYQGWRLDQLVQHRPSDLKTFVESYLAKIGIEITNGSQPPAAVPVPTKNPSSIPAPPPPVEGSLLGRMEIPRLALSTVVLEGDSNQVLRKAAGHIPGTALPGRAGNVAIAGHRDTFFRALRNIHEGDDIALETIAGTYHYRVDSTAIVAPKDIQVLKPSDQPSLTLVTCYPFSYVGSAPKRYIVHARQVERATDESSPFALSGPPPRLLPPARSRALGDSTRLARSAHHEKSAHQVARRWATPGHRHRSPGSSTDLHASAPLGSEKDATAVALSDPPADTHKSDGLRRRALAVPKRFASWLRSLPKSHAGSD